LVAVSLAFRVRPTPSSTAETPSISYSIHFQAHNNFLLLRPALNSHIIPLRLSHNDFVRELDPLPL
jgi:hypothetical protein